MGCAFFHGSLYLLGFLSFMAVTDKDTLRPPLAAGAVGGLLVSVIGIFLFLPFFVLKKKDFH